MFIGFLFPFFSLLYLIAPKSQYGLFIRKPFIKFICHTASYLTFLFLLLLASQHVDRKDNQESTKQGPEPTSVEWMILPWVVGNLCLGLKNQIWMFFFFFRSVVDKFSWISVLQDLCGLKSNKCGTVAFRITFMIGGTSWTLSWILCICPPSHWSVSLTLR